MTSWTAEELRELDRAREIRVAGRRDDGSLRPLITVWHVVVDGAVYARSVRGADGKWYQGVLRHRGGGIDWGRGTRDIDVEPDASRDDAIDAAYLAKYGDGSATRSVITGAARNTTIRIEPKA